MEKYIVWHIQGGLGKNIAATSLLTSLQKKYEDRKIVIVASYPEVFLNHSSVYRVYKLGTTQYFYDDYIKDKDTIIFRQEYIDMVNEELELTNPIYSFSDIQSALKYASESVTIYPEEVGKEVYDILIAEKVEEYLKNYKNELETIYR